jgi:cellulose synthase/poly-beta-1,6-N-acetylglucosamine synthase-like glycosyltransferase
MLVMLYGLFRIPRYNTGKKHFLSVVIAAHNEEKTIEKCLNCLIKQDYPEELYEIIIADDRSSDKTPQIILNYCNRYKKIRSVRIDPEESFVPKKTALIKGLNIARGDIIISTDADCIQPVGWLTALNSHFSKKVGMVIGHTEYLKSASFWKGIDSIDYFSQRVMGIAFLGLNSAYTCTASNIAYRKEIFDNNKNDFKNAGVRPAEDNLILHWVHLKSSYEIAAAFEPSSIVTTHGASNFRHFMNQRFRWAAYGGNITTFSVKLFFVPLLLYYCFIWISMLLTIFIPAILYSILLSYLCKTLVDFLFMLKASMLYRNVSQLKYFFPISVIHLILVPIIVLKGNLFTFDWKENTYSINSQDVSN